MPRPEKVQAVAEIKERLEGARAVFLAEYAGLTVGQQQQLRRKLKEQGAEFKVVKMTLARRAAGELDLSALDEYLLGPTGLAFAEEDPVGAAKVLKEFAKDHEALRIKGGLLGRDLLSPERVSELAEIEPREVLLAKLAGAMKAPLTNMASLLQAMPRNFASMLQQLIEKKPADAAPAVPATEEAATEDAATDEAAPAAEAPTAEPAAEEAPTEEAAADAPATEPESEADTDVEPKAAAAEADATEPAADDTESDDTESDEDTAEPAEEE